MAWEDDEFYSETAHKLASEIGRTARGRKKLTARQLLGRFGFSKRGPQNVQTVTRSLLSAGLRCEPHLTDADGLDAPLVIVVETTAAISTPGAKVRNRTAQKAPSTPDKATTVVGASSHITSDIPTPPPKPMSLQEVLGFALQATVHIRLDDGHGSGFVIDRTGIVLTARHVVGRREKVMVHFHDGKNAEGDVVLANTTLDYAFVKIPPRPVAFQLRPGFEPQVGQAVYAVGTPLDRNLSGSITRGIISAVERVQGGVSYLQTDAAIHGGNSGGPLINERGTIVGMNVAGRVEGDVNFALPVAYLATAWEFLHANLPEIEKRQYCVECGFSNSPDSWLECATWVCCGNCGIMIGEFRRASHDE